MSQSQKQVWERNDNILYFRLKRLIGMDASGCADDRQQIICACAVVFLPK